MWLLERHRHRRSSLNGKWSPSAFTQGRSQPCGSGSSGSVSARETRASLTQVIQTQASSGQ
eukprot:10438309-Lingulodinium_polyedra.AAC.1